MHVSTIRPEHSTALTAWHLGACIECAKLRGLLPEKERTSGNRGECGEHGVNYKFSFPKKPKYRKEEQEQEGQKLKRRYGALSVDMRAIYSIEREQDDAQRLDQKKVLNSDRRLWQGSGPESKRIEKR